MNKLVDAHCHVITDPDNTFCGDDGGSQGTLRCVMSSNPYDWNNLKKLAGRSTSKTIYAWDLVCILGTATYFMWEVGATRFLTIKMYWSIRMKNSSTVWFRCFPNL
ncbi:CGH_1_HP_G0103110.mRNA.1.CDS.1 [Saccharomyces cerevisiae]|nr:CGH_1_HP_G0103110.mRNA.1.CDS.1 [Saccharomyces cerevisiae]CAI6950250.1 CGH_1_HP_G0103110.mRNA.1.CDS.1 [Saccharomyces cerevisiae]